MWLVHQTTCSIYEVKPKCTGPGDESINDMPFHAGQEVVRIVEPLESLENRPLSIWCIVPEGGASGFSLRENNVIVGDPRINPGSRNTTHQQFILDPVSREDNDRAFVCSISELFSNPATLTVFCKLNLIDLRNYTIHCMELYFFDALWMLLFKSWNTGEGTRFHVV